ncbi:MAG: DNA-protecting protein DprA [Anaerolineae bacterium]|nr:DNA-protecting protein DprA [Anaerolineae bacterium]
MPDLTLWIALSLTDHIGSKTLGALLRHFGGDPAAILAADTAELQQVVGVGPKIARSIQAINLDEVRQSLAEWETTDISILTLASPNGAYPPRLLEIEDPPATLFVRGCGPPLFDRAVSIVGTRSPSAEAAQWAYQLGAELTQAGFTVVSGLALGIDTAAHEGALSAAAGRTVAVLGCGLFNIYPPENQALAQRCAMRGAILSEVHPAAPPSAPRLVARNRIISGLSDALIVVETTATGGAMHAARFAQRQQRPVYTFNLPASGNRELLANGAHQLDAHSHSLDVLIEQLLGE